mgnify:CR=1 FL=1
MIGVLVVGDNSRCVIPYSRNVLVICSVAVKLLVWAWSSVCVEYLFLNSRFHIVSASRTCFPRLKRKLGFIYMISDCIGIVC